MTVWERIKNLEHYFLNIIIIWLAVLFYRTNHYYHDFLRAETKTAILYLAIAYTIIGLVYYLFNSKDKTTETKGKIIFQAIKRFSKDSYRYMKSFNSATRNPWPKIEKHEKTALLFLWVKLFFLPIMLNFFFDNFFSVKNNLLHASFTALLSMNSFNNLLFPLLLSAIFLIDTTWFSFGYIFESSLLKNKVKSVEPTVIGWAVALICYPPFNGLLTKYVNWYANDYIVLSNQYLTFTLRIFVILLLTIYVGASISLGTRCSNLTNRGIVSKGTYAIVRHPAYISKNMAWWLTILPVFSLKAALSMGAWSLIYHFRAITEERHLSKDPDYVKYCKKVKYRYIPFIY